VRIDELFNVQTLICIFQLANIPESRKTVKMYLFLVQLARRKVDILL